MKTRQVSVKFIRIALFVALILGMLQVFSALSVNAVNIPDLTHVYGYVSDPAGRPLSGVYVTTTGDYDYTDSNGRYDLYIERDGQYHGIGFSLDGFHYGRDVFKADRQTVRVDKILYPIQSFTFEGRTWNKQIRNTGTSIGTDYFNTEYYKVTWNIGTNIMVNEKLSTYLRYVGVSTSYTFNAFGTDSIAVTFDAQTSAGYSGQNRMYVGVFTSNWVRVGNVQYVSSKTFKTFTLTFSGLNDGQTYNIFFFYSDAWYADYDATFYLKNVNISPAY